MRFVSSVARLGSLAMRCAQATAEVHGMRVSTLEDVKPAPEALKIVPQNMAELYKMVPLSFEADTLTPSRRP